MTGRLIRTAVALYLAAALAVGYPGLAQAQSQQTTPPQAQTTTTQTQTPAAQQTPAAMPYPNLRSGPDYTKGRQWFPNIFAPYFSINVPPPDLTNTPAIYSLIHDGKLELTLQDATALALQNNLDIRVQRYLPWFGETDVLRAEGGGTPTGSFVLGSGGGGTFDPVIGATASIADNTTPVNNPFISGTGTGTNSLVALKSHQTQLNIGYSQELHTGTSFSFGLDNTRSSSSSSANFFNPSVSSQLFASIQQPLLRGFGLLTVTRFIVETKNTLKEDNLTFEEQVINSVTQVENQYWQLVYARQNVDVQKAALATSQKLYEDNKRQLEIGTLAPLDVLTAESEIATDNQLVIQAQTNLLQQQTLLLQLITKNLLDPAFQDVEVVPTTPIEESVAVPSIALPDAVKEAWANRPELQVEQFQLANDDIEIKATRNELLPALTLSANYQSSGLGGISRINSSTPLTFVPNLNVPIVDASGNPIAGEFVGVGNTFNTTTTVVPGGVGDAYSAIFQNQFPSYSASLNLSLPLRNRSAQADHARALLNERQYQTIYQQEKNTIVVGVRNALIAIQQDAAQVVATEKATQLAQQTLDDEQKKYSLGASTSYNVILRSRDLTAAKGNELLAKANLQIALVNFNLAMGRTLSANNITLADARHRAIDLEAQQPLIPGTLGGRLAGEDVFGLGLHK
ncbi:MAG TPA: TolC family protein [Candidatus Acidoferrales bacterium]|jgi:outer membrane protein TolC|nr:TolC family protein [Candidatus Acidoferrales bacterium]